MNTAEIVDTLSGKTYNMRMRLRIWIRRSAVFLAILTLIFAWLVLLWAFSPDEIVQRIGVENTYIVSFFLALFGGVSFLTSTSFYASIATFALGGSNPYLLGIAGGTGLFISDIAFFYFFLYGKKLIRGKWQSKLDRLERFMRRLPQGAVLAVVFVYAGLTPFPSDILMASLALSNYTLKTFAPFLFAGNITLITLISLLAQLGIRPF